MANSTKAKTPAEQLREPFPAEQIGKLPKPTKKDNPKGRCDVCGGYHGLPAVHLDYVGHAAVTDRLLKVDPSWTWQPLAADEDGLPLTTHAGLYDGTVGLWIELTVAGVTRPGFGDGRNIKEAISDALRNAAMRFGVALDLWAKEDLSEQEEEVVRKDGGLAPFPVPTSWAKITKWYEEHGGAGAPELAELFTKAAGYHLYGETDTKKLTKEQKAVLFQKAAGAVVWLAENDNTPLGPAPSVEHYQRAWAHVMEGAVLEVPEWRPPAEPAADPPVDDEAARIADEVFASESGGES